jgi:hypothetical protein
VSYQSVLEGLHERFATVEGIKVLLQYEPTSVQVFPTLYSVLDSFEVERRGQVRAVTYRTLHRLVFRWQDNEQALAEMIPYVDSIPEAVEEDKHLGGRLVAGLAEITDGEVMFVSIGGADLLALDFYSSVVEK